MVERFCDGLNERPSGFGPVSWRAGRGTGWGCSRSRSAGVSIGRRELPILAALPALRSPLPKPSLMNSDTTWVFCTPHAHAGPRTRGSRIRADGSGLGVRLRAERTGSSKRGRRHVVLQKRRLLDQRLFLHKALNHRLANPQAETASAAQRARTLLVWGGRDEDGVPHLDSAFVVDAVPSLPTAGGEYVLEGATADWTPLFSFAFAMPANPDAVGDEASFVFAVPLEPAWTGNLASITLSGPGGSAILDESTDRSMAILRSSRTGQVRGFLADVPTGSLAQVAADAAGGRRDSNLEVIVSRGVPELR